MSRSKRHRGRYAAPIGEPPEGGRRPVRPVLPRVAARVHDSFFGSIPRGILRLSLLIQALSHAGPSTEFRSCAWRLAFEVSSVGAWGAIAGTVKLFLPPRQSRGNSLGYSNVGRRRRLRRAHRL